MTDSSTVAWKGATKMGCGKGVCDNRGVVVCAFDKGNGIGSFDVNVSKPKDKTLGMK